MQYATAADARTALKVFGRARGSKRFYLCQRCRAFHLASQAKAKA